MSSESSVSYFETNDTTAAKGWEMVSPGAPIEVPYLSVCLLCQSTLNAPVFEVNIKITTWDLEESLHYKRVCYACARRIIDTPQTIVAQQAPKDM